MITLQHVIFPEPSICTEHGLYYRLEGSGGYSSSDRSIHMSTRAELFFDTYFNLFSVGKWASSGRLNSLYFSGEAEGYFELRVFHAIPDKSWEMLYCDVHNFDQRTAFRADLSHFTHNATQGVLMVRIKAIGENTTFYAGRYETDQEPEQWPKMAISITTFRREEEVQNTVKRIDQFICEHQLGDRIHVQVVDNGQTADISSNDNITLIKNRNLGGAGGFARGLIEARKQGFSHCLFMDDDASFDMENLYRAYHFLAFAHNSRTAVAGAMINNTHKWRMWENGAVFDRSCKPQYIGTDLRDPHKVFEMEFETNENRQRGYYGGWWFFAFPIQHVEHFPFPYFVRGDDVNFSIANHFEIQTLNGVVSFQDDFTEKESPMTLYLDLRGHLLHHMMFESMEISPWKTIGIAWRFFRRSLERFQYETAEAQLLSVQDVMRGPSFFTEHIDMAERRQVIKELAPNENWKPVEQVKVTRRSLIPTRNPVTNTIMYLTFNGHLLPFSSRWMNHSVIPIHERGIVWPAYGSTRLTFMNSARDKAYTVQQSKTRFFALLRKFSVIAIDFVRDYKRLRDEYRKAFPQMTSEAYWLEMTKTDATD